MKLRNIMIAAAFFALAAGVFAALAVPRRGDGHEHAHGHEHHEHEDAHGHEHHEHEDLHEHVREARPPDDPLGRIVSLQKRLAPVHVAEAKTRTLSVELRLLGTVAYDESGIADLAAWFPGRVDELYAGFIGARVERGEPLARIYSPELTAAQEEHLVALRRAESRDERAGRRMLEASRRRLGFLGMIPEQVDELERRGSADEYIVFRAPASGTVTERNAFKGGYFKTGDRLFRLADLSTVWLLSDAYERDLSFVYPGQEAEFTTKALPGEVFPGEVVFIDPVVRPACTVGLRMEVENPNGLLKPGMAGAAVLAYELGDVLSIPAAAPVHTGRRTVVFIEEAPLVYRLREVVLGARAGGYYPVVSGLDEGELVAARGNFILDPALGLRDRPGIVPGILGLPESELLDLDVEIDEAVPDDPHRHH